MHWPERPCAVVRPVVGATVAAVPLVAAVGFASRDIAAAAVVTTILAANTGRAWRAKTAAAVVAANDIAVVVVGLVVAAT